MRNAPPSTNREQIPGMGVGSSSASVAAPARRRGRPPRSRAPVSFFSVEDAASLLRTTPEHLRQVLHARFSFFSRSKSVGGAWQISSLDLERWIRHDDLKPMLLISEVALLLRTTRARVHSAVRRKELRAVRLFNEDRPGSLRFNWLEIARAVGQERGGIFA